MVTAPRAATTGSVDAFAGQRVSRVELVGVPALLRDAIAATLVVKPEAVLDREAVGRDLAMLEKLQIADDIVLAATPDGNRVAIRYELEPRGRLERVTIHGIEHRSLALLRELVGALDNPRRIESVTQHLRAQFRAEGYLDAELTSTYVARGHVCTAGTLGRRYVIDRIDATGDGISRAELERYLARRISVNTVGGPYHQALLEEALLEVENEYHERGYAVAKIAAPQVTVDRERARIAIRIPITQGPRFTLGEIQWRGSIEPAGRTTFALARGDVYAPRALRAAATRLRAWAEARDLSVTIDPVLHVQLGRVDLTITVTKDTHVR